MTADTLCLVALAVVIVSGLAALAAGVAALVPPRWADRIFREPNKGE